LLRAKTFFGRDDDRVHFGHHLIVRDARASLSERRLDLGAKPANVCVGFFGRFECGDEGVKYIPLYRSVVTIVA
jgi:hypothetical protein